MPDLTAARSNVLSLLTDACRVTRDIAGRLDDALNLLTGQLVPPDPDSVTIWTGPCLITRRGGSTSVEEGGLVVARPRYRARVPWDAEPFQVGDVLTITESASDPRLVGRAFVVAELPQDSSLLVSRHFPLEERLPQRSVGA